jgi:hypothetical protein
MFQIMIRPFYATLPPDLQSIIESDIIVVVSIIIISYWASETSVKLAGCMLFPREFWASLLRLVRVVLFDRSGENNVHKYACLVSTECNFRLLRTSKSVN